MSLTASESRALLVSGLLIVLATVVRATLVRAPAEEWRSSLRAVAPDSLLERARAHDRRSARARAPLAPGERVDPNRAPEHELERLPGVGPALAREIVHQRRVHGDFVWAEDLDRVPGIGPALLERLRDRLTLPPRPLPAPPASPAYGGPAPSASLAPTAPPGAGLLDLNAATAEELQRLPAIGPKRAAQILALRQARGRFRSLEELLEVPGIGPKTLARLRPHLRVFP